MNLDPIMLQNLRLLSEKQQRSISAIIRLAIIDYLKK